MNKKIGFFSILILISVVSVIYKVPAQDVTAAQKRVLIEQVTEGLNGQSPTGLVAMDQIRKNLGDKVVFVNLHKSDNPNLFTFDGNYIMNAMGTTIPCGIIDRRKFNGTSAVAVPPSDWAAKIAIQMNESPKVDVQIASITVNGLDVNIKVDVEFLEDIFGDIRVSCLVVEDYVRGPGKGYAQLNDFNNKPGHPFYGLGDTIFNFDHMRVLKSYFSSTWGDWVDIDSNNPQGHYWAKGSKRSLIFSRQVFTNINQMYAVAFVNQYNETDVTQRPVFNVVEKKLNNVGVQETPTMDGEVNVYPNPVDLLGRVEFSLDRQSSVIVRVFDIFGREVLTNGGKNYPQGKNSFFFNAVPLKSGCYIAVVETNGQVMTARFIK